MNSLSKSYQYYKIHGLSPVLVRSVEKTLLKTSHGEKLYWQTAPQVYGRAYHTPLDHGRAFQPLKLVFIDPNEVEYVTGRETMLGARRRSNIGTCLAGDWDKTTSKKAQKHWVVPSGEFSDGVVFKSLEQRLLQGRSWEDTPLYELALKHTDSDDRWHDCATEDQVWERFLKLERHYERIAEEGYMSQFELVCRGYETRDYINCFLNEVNIDVGRDGDLLFADGQHRLSIAKLLGIDRIPAFVVVRHTDWVRDGMFTEEERLRDHPDTTGHILPRPAKFCDRKV